MGNVMSFLSWLGSVLRVRRGWCGCDWFVLSGLIAGVGVSGWMAMQLVLVRVCGW